MLSERQCEVIVNRVNKDTDIPFLRESSEEKVIGKVVETLNEHLEPALRVICPRPYVECIKIALTEGVPIEERREKIARILDSELSAPLAREMNGKLDVDLIPESVEQRILDVCCKKIVEEMVEWTVGEIDDRLSERLEDSRN